MLDKLVEMCESCDLGERMVKHDDMAGQNVLGSTTHYRTSATFVKAVPQVCHNKLLCPM